MKLKVHVEDKTYIIECGDGNNSICWLGLQGCLLYGQESYPKGVYIPNLVKNMDLVLHPQ
jgi:hypothetical protein